MLLLIQRMSFDALDAAAVCWLVVVLFDMWPPESFCKS
jgi:hypothetical protein